LGQKDPASNYLEAELYGVDNAFIVQTFPIIKRYQVTPQLTMVRTNPAGNDRIPDFVASEVRTPNNQDDDYFICVIEVKRAAQLKGVRPESQQATKDDHFRESMKQLKDYMNRVKSEARPLTRANIPIWGVLVINDVIYARVLYGYNELLYVLDGFDGVSAHSHLQNCLTTIKQSYWQARDAH
jgi:hypothetical protein